MISLKARKMGGVLADDMGLGKTRQIASLLAYCKNKKIRGPNLVVVPLSVLRNWEIELETSGLKVILLNEARQIRTKNIKNISKNPNH